MVCLPALIRSGSSSPANGKRAHAEHAVLALQWTVIAGGMKFDDQGRDADAEIDVETVLELARGAAPPSRRVTRPSPASSPTAPLWRTVRCSMRFSKMRPGRSA